MAGRGVGAGFLIVLIVIMVVYVVEFFIPLSAKADFDNYCRCALIRMEIAGGLEASNTSSLNNKLTARGFNSISINGTSSAKQGELLTIEVEAFYKYNKLVGFLSRIDTNVRMYYKKASIARRIIN